MRGEGGGTRENWEFLQEGAGNLAAWAAGRYAGRRIALCTEEALLGTLSPLIETLGRAIPGLEVVAYPGGEAFKSRETKSLLEDHLLERGLGKDTLLLALGGGTVTDLVGFAAATYLRGVPYASLPTTLLCMVDAAHGGKVAVNTPRGKNLIGLFAPPEKVFIPLESLGTLPENEYLCGLAECLKHGLIADIGLFEWMASELAPLLARRPDSVRRLVESSVAAKLGIVAKDPEEKSGVRNLLNAGHTVAHALEALSGYSLPHGMAVGAGLLVEGAAAAHEGYLPKGDFERASALLWRYGFDMPAKFPPVGDILEAASADKKNRRGVVSYVPLGGIGRPALPAPHTAPLSEEALGAAIALLASKGRP